MNISKESLQLMKFLCVLVHLINIVRSADVWDAPGCHLVGHRQKIAVHGCVSFWATTNACRGYCVSYSVPTGQLLLARNPSQLYTSRSSCCNIVETHEVSYRARCIGGMRTFKFRSAAKCECLYCNTGDVVIYDLKK